MFNNLKQDFTKQYPKANFSEFEKAIDAIGDAAFESTEGVAEDFEVSISIEKINALQENVFITIEKDGVVVNLEYENGISNGTQLNDYSFSDCLIPSARVESVLVDVKVDRAATLEWFRANNNVINLSWSKAQSRLAQCKERIIKKLHNQSYDNYVTGGGTTKTDAHYANFRKEMNSKGVFWTEIHKDIEVDVILH